MIGTRLVAIATFLLALGGCVHSDVASVSAVDRLARDFIDTLSEEDVAAFRDAERSELPMFHFGAGSRVRQLYFGPDGEGREALCTPTTYCDIDSQSMRSVERAWSIIHGVG